jgi:uncharacterized tellurite resistance protein B-like protein
MIESLKALFGKPDEVDEEALRHQLHLAAAALMIEMTRADYVVAPAEQQALKDVLGPALELESAEIDELLTLAGERADRATSLYEFTRLINSHYSDAEKLELIESMWRVAYADGDLDKYEERLIRQVSDLIHVPHKAFINAKLSVSKALTKPANAP